jgi:hypothetical protein
MVLSEVQKVEILMLAKIIIPVQEDGYSYGQYHGQEVLYYKPQNRLLRSVALPQNVLALLVPDSLRRDR